MKIHLKIIFSIIIAGLIMIIILIGMNFRIIPYVVQPTDHALVIKNGTVQEVLKPGLHISFSKIDSILIYPTQRVSRLKIDVRYIHNLSFPDSCKIIEIPWVVSDPKKYYETIGSFDKILVNEKIEFKLNSELSLLCSTKDDAIRFTEHIQILNDKLKASFLDKGLKIYDIILKNE